MKHLYLFIFLTISYSTFGQNYQMFYSGDERIFQFNGSNHRGLRIDSVQFSAGDSIFYGTKAMYERPDNGCIDLFKSWVGDSVIVQADGTHVFHNLMNQPITILAQADIGDTWVAFENEDATLHATITGLNYESTNIGADSLKTIQFQCMDSGGNLIDHAINDMNLVISKEHGVINLINLAIFPQQYNGGIESIHQYQLVGLNGVGVKNLTLRDIFDFQPGDALHVLEKDMSYGEGPEKHTIFTYLSRSDYQDSIIYDVLIERDIYNWENGVMYFESSWVDTVLSTIRPHPIDNLPLEGDVVDNNYPWLFSYYQQEGIEGNLSKIRNPNQEYQNEMEMSNYCWYVGIDAGCFTGGDYEYYEGKGGPYFYCGFGPMYQSRELVYSFIDSIAVGTPFELILSSEASLAQIPVSVFPNPTTKNITIQLPAEWVQGDWVLFDNQGRSIIHEKVFSGQNQFILNEIPSGLYVFRLFDENGKARNSGKISIVR